MKYISVWNKRKLSLMIKSKGQKLYAVEVVLQLHMQYTITSDFQLMNKNYYG